MDIREKDTASFEVPLTASFKDRSDDGISKDDLNVMKSLPQVWLQHEGYLKPVGGIMRSLNILNGRTFEYHYAVNASDAPDLARDSPTGHVKFAASLKIERLRKSIKIDRFELVTGGISREEMISRYIPKNLMKIFPDNLEVNESVDPAIDAIRINYSWRAIVVDIGEYEFLFDQDFFKPVEIDLKI
jgi:hypothetical protein